MFLFKNVFKTLLSCLLLVQLISAAPPKAKDKWEMTAVGGSGVDATYQVFVPHSIFEAAGTVQEAENRAKRYFQWLSQKQTNPGELTDSGGEAKPRAQMVAATYWPTGPAKGWHVSEIPKGSVKTKVFSDAGSPIHRHAFANAKYPHAEDGSWVMAETAAKLPAGTARYPVGTVTAVWGLRSEDFEKDPAGFSSHVYRPKGGKKDGYRIPMCARGDVGQGDREPTCQVVATQLGVTGS